MEKQKKEYVVPTMDELELLHTESLLQGSSGEEPTLYSDELG